MRNYSLISGADFQPFTFEDYSRPYQMYKEAYKEAEDAYGELEELSSVWDMKLTNPEDAPLKQQLDAYKDLLASEAGTIATEGLNPLTKRNLSKLKGKYLSTFAPLEEAYNTNKEIAKEQRQAYLANPSIMYEWDAADRSLTDTIKNPNAVPKVLDGNTVRKEVAETVATMARAIHNGTIENFADEYGLNKDYLRYIQSEGYSQDIIDGTIAKALDPNSTAAYDPNLLRVVNAAVDKAVPNDWSDTTKAGARLHATKYAAEGLVAGIQQTQEQVVDNWREKERIRHLNDMEEIREKNLMKNNPNQFLRQDIDNVPYYYDRTSRMWFKEDESTGERFAVSDPQILNQLQETVGTRKKTEIRSDFERAIVDDGGMVYDPKQAMNRIEVAGYNVLGVLANYKRKNKPENYDFFEPDTDEGTDVPGKWHSLTRSNLTTRWGNVSVKYIKNDAPISALPESEWGTSISGFNEYMSSGNITPGSNWEKIKNQLELKGLWDKFEENKLDIEIARVPRGTKSGQLGASQGYDYIVFTREKE